MKKHYCPYCGANFREPCTQCTVCGQSFWTDASAPMPEAQHPEKFFRRKPGLHDALWFLLIAAAFFLLFLLFCLLIPIWITVRHGL